ncbi:MAG: LPS-assembly protein LptD [Rhodospirillales bacterium]|nr:LPS-assembly protein LptD [Alphaproteobacteria bacterium]MCB9987306.1 LPS-assembly protein LptD [Rhodospirillales bacterium]USO07838.1 MAG: LPS-assembly protein LptD [Rhodospirillales bacterium]
MMGVLLAGAGAAALAAPARAAGITLHEVDTQSYDAETVLRGGADFTAGVQVAQAAPDSPVNFENQMAPAAIPSAPPYTKTTERKPVAPPQPAGKPVQPKSSPVDYVADTADYNQADKIVTLSGRVELTQDGRTLKADKVVYNLKDDIATAEGNVVVTNPNGDVYHAQSVELSDHMREGLVDRMFVTMADGSRVWAATGIKESELRYKLKSASYTACKVCATDPDKRPPWRVHAKKVELLRDEHRIVYRNAWLDLGGVPVFYTPYFSHPDGSIDQKSGLLTPSFGLNSQLGAFYSQPYYWGISPSMDTTFWVMPTTKQNVLLRNQFRKRFSTAYLQTDTSLTDSARTDSVNGVEVKKKDDIRGHIFAHGGWDINQNWRGRMDVALASDPQYLRQYGFSDDSILTNQVLAERFQDRDYVLIKGMAFQDLRAVKTDQPDVLPYAEAQWLGDPNGLFGGRWKVDSSFLSLLRNGNGQDVWRGSTRGSWAREDILPVGLVVKSQAGARVDAYATTNREAHALNPAVSSSNQQGRFFPNAQFSAGYPLKSDFKSFQLLVEPVATLYLSPNINNNSTIPNEDSQDVQLNVDNLMDGNRFPGLDRIEDNSHVAYGLKAGMYNYSGGQLSGFLGQSYNLRPGDNPFPVGSGLENRSSDYVGSLNASFSGGKHTLSYQFQVNSHTLRSELHELYGVTRWGPMEVDGNYLFDAGAPGTIYPNSREQIRLGSSVNLNDQWTVRGDAIYDLSSDQSQRGLRRSIFTLNYTHECYDFAVTADRYLANASSGVQDTTIMFRIGLKNLGEYKTDAFKLNGQRN